MLVSRILVRIEILDATQVFATVEAEIVAAAPLAANWVKTGEARHTFTHFHLVLTVLSATGSPVPGGRYLPVADVRDTAPTVMRKALDAARSD